MSSLFFDNCSFFLHFEQEERCIKELLYEAYFPQEFKLGRVWDSDVTFMVKLFVDRDRKHVHDLFG